MNLEELKEHIKFEEGVKLNDNGEHILYNDSLGYKTLGIGHLVKATDPENEMEVGTVVSQERVDECFEADLKIAIKDAETFCEGMEVDDNIKECVTHMVFQLGLPRLNKFKNFKQALLDGDIETAQAEMKDSLWYRQTTNRADRLIEKLGKSA
jgi:GH24 family phage-related lysozyme (muramidase)